MPAYAVAVTLQDLDRDLQQDMVASDVFDELTKENRAFGLEGPPSDRESDGDTFKMTVRLSAADETKAERKAWNVLGTATAAVNARHWIGRPGDTDPINSVKALEGKQVRLEVAAVK